MDMDYSSPLDDPVDEEEFGTPINDAPAYKPYVDSAVIEQFDGGCAPCSNIFKNSFHVMLACLAAIIVPLPPIRALLSRVPYLATVDDSVLRAVVTVVLYILISRLVGKLLF